MLNEKVFFTGYLETEEDEDLLDKSLTFQVNDRRYLKKGKIEPRIFWLFACGEFPINFKERYYFYSEDHVIEHTQLPKQIDFMTLYFYTQSELGYKISQVSIYWSREK